MFCFVFFFFIYFILLCEGWAAGAAGCLIASHVKALAGEGGISTILRKNLLMFIEPHFISRASETLATVNHGPPTKMIQPCCSSSRVKRHDCECARARAHTHTHAQESLLPGLLPRPLLLFLCSVLHHHRTLLAQTHTHTHTPTAPC